MSKEYRSASKIRYFKTWFPNGQPHTNGESSLDVNWEQTTLVDNDILSMMEPDIDNKRMLLYLGNKFNTGNIDGYMLMYDKEGHIASCLVIPNNDYKHKYKCRGRSLRIAHFKIKQEHQQTQ